MQKKRAADKISTSNCANFDKGIISCEPGTEMQHHSKRYPWTTNRKLPSPPSSPNMSGEAEFAASHRTLKASNGGSSSWGALKLSKLHKEEDEESKEESEASLESDSFVISPRLTKLGSSKSHNQIATTSESEQVTFTVKDLFQLLCVSESCTDSLSNTTVRLVLQSLGLDKESEASKLLGERTRIDFDDFCELLAPTHSFATLASTLAATRGITGPAEREGLRRSLTVRAKTASAGVDVFLGGACNPTTWRKDLAIPALQRSGISFFNPQVEEWTQELVAMEAKMKTEAKHLFFVIGAETRSIASMIEVSELLASGRQVILVIEPLLDCSDDASSGQIRFPPEELKDLRRGRAYLTDVAERRGIAVYQSIEHGLQTLLRLTGKS